MNFTKNSSLNVSKRADGNTAVFEVEFDDQIASKRSSLHEDISEKSGSFCESGLFRIVSEGTCSVTKIPGVGVELFGEELLISSLRGILSVLSVLIAFGLEITEINCV